MSEPRAGGRRSRRRALWPLLALVTVVGVVFIGVFPTRTYLRQQEALARAEKQLEVISAENDRMEQRVEALNTPEEIERLARQNYNMARPGEEVFAILPPHQPPPAVPNAWPFAGLAHAFDP